MKTELFHFASENKGEVKIDYDTAVAIMRPNKLYNPLYMYQLTSKQGKGEFKFADTTFLKYLSFLYKTQYFKGFTKKRRIKDIFFNSEYQNPDLVEIAKSSLKNGGDPTITTNYQILKYPEEGTFTTNEIIYKGNDAYSMRREYHSVDGETEFLIKQRFYTPGGQYPFEYKKIRPWNKPVYMEWGTDGV